MDLPHETTGLMYILVIIFIGFLIFHWFLAHKIPISLLSITSVIILVLNIGITLFTLPLLSLNPGPSRKKDGELLWVASGEYANYMMAVVIPIVLFFIFTVFVGIDE